MYISGWGMDRVWPAVNDAGVNDPPRWWLADLLSITQMN